MVDEITTTTEEKPLGRREAMEKAFDSLSGGSEAPESGTDQPAAVSKSTDAVSTGKGRDEPVIKTADTTKVAKPARSGVPDADKGVVGKPGEAKAQQAPAGHKAPQSWRPDVREKFGNLPPEVQAEIDKREKDINRTMNLNSQHRKMSEEFARAVSPYEGLIRASGVTPIQAVGNLMQTAAVLQTGTPAQKASTIANIIRSYGIDIAMLDQILAGNGAPASAREHDRLAQMLDERLKPVQSFMENLNGAQRQSQQALYSDAAREAQTFASEAGNEFFEDLRQDMADILEMSANRGREMSLKQAYDLAAAQHPEISKVVNERTKAEQTRKNAEQIARSRRAAVSQPAGTPGAMGAGKVGTPANRRDAISQAWDDLQTR